MGNNMKLYAPSVKMETKNYQQFYPDVMRPKFWPGGNTGHCKDLGYYFGSGPEEKCKAAPTDCTLYIKG